MNHMEFDKAYFDAGIDRVGTESEKWDGMIEETGDADMLPMWVADMDFPSAPAIAKALEGVLSWGTWGYTIAGEKDAAALCAYWARRHGVQFSPDAVLMSPCVVTGMRVALRALTKEGDGVLIHPPVYGPFFQSIKANNRRVVESPLVRGADGRFAMNLAEMEEKLASGEAKAVMICSPHNPVGRSWDENELSAVVGLCARFDVPLICDEIHADFVYAPKKHHCILSVPGAQDRAVMLCAASKTFNVAGLEQSAIVCDNADVREAMKRDMAASGVKAGNAFALAATRAAYTGCDDWLDGLKAYLMGSRDMVAAFVAERMPRVRLTPLEATYLMWLDCRALGLAQDELLVRIKAAHVKVNDGLFFGEQGRGFVRLNFAMTHANLREALRRIGEAVEKR